MDKLCAFIGIAVFCNDVADFFTSPLWYWGLWWLAIVVSAWVIGWFFAPARPYVGVIVIAATAGIVAFWHGLRRGRERERARHKTPPQPRPVPQPTSGPFDLNWLWSWR